MTCFCTGEAVSREAMAHPSPASDGHRSSRSEEDARRKTTSIHTVRPSPKRRDGPDSRHRGNIGERGGSVSSGHRWCAGESWTGVTVCTTAQDNRTATAIEGI